MRAHLAADREREFLTVARCLDAETGLHDNWWRSYDPTTDRYTQFDPTGLRGGINGYIYAKANPLKYFDRTGRSPAGVGAAAALALEGICASVAYAKAQELLSNGTFTSDKQQHCYVSCAINRCSLLLFPYITAGIGEVWESLPGGVNDPADMDANVYGIAKSIEYGSCQSHCQSCPVQ